MKKLFRWLIVLWFVVYSALFTPLAYAASAGGWAFNSFNVDTSVVTALKGGASASVAVAKSPITAKIAKGIVGGVIAGLALPLAISQISGIALNALDWVLDPANNAVKWKPKAGTKVGYYKVDTVTAPTAQQACEKYINAVGGFGKITSIVAKSDQFCVVYSDLYPDGGAAAMWSFVETGNYNWRSIPIPTVANKIFDNAKTDSDSRSVVNDAVKEYVNEGSADTVLDNAKADADATHGCGTGTSWNGSACVATPSTPDTPFDPSSILDAIASLFDAVMSLPDVINSALDDLFNNIKDLFQPLIDALKSLITKLTDFFDDIIGMFTDFVDWFKSDPDPQTDSKPDIDTSPPTKSATDFDTDYLRFGDQCPATPSTSLSVGAVSVPLSIDLTPLCDFVVMVRPAILAMAYLSALFVVARAIGETQ